MTRILTALGSLTLLVTAGLHMTGLQLVKDATGKIEMAFLRDALSAMWVMPSIHWLLIACLAFGCSFYRSRACAAMLIAFGVWILIDALIVFSHVGMFIGAITLSAAGLCYLIAGFMLRSSILKERKIN